MSSRLIAPHGGTLIDLSITEDRAVELREASRDWLSWNLTARQLCDLELMTNGGFSPLAGFMGQADYDRVCAEMRLVEGTLWPIPVTLDVSGEFAASVSIGDPIVLRDPEGVMLAVLTVEDIWEPNKNEEAEQVFGTTNVEHPGVAYLDYQAGSHYLGGRIESVQSPIHYDYRLLRLSPAETRARFEQLGWHRIVAFQTRNPMHRAHVELTRRAAVECGANLLIQPAVGMTKPGDVDHYTRVRAYKAIQHRYPRDTTVLALLPLAMRMGGPREAIWHSIIRKNHGCTHLIVGRDHAGPGSDSNGEPFYGPYDAQEMLAEHTEELGVEMVPFQLMVYVETDDKYYPVGEVPDGKTWVSVSGTELRQRLAEGREIPDWFTYPEVADELRRTNPPRSRQGFTVFFTGLSGSGKSTIANALLVKMLELGGRPVTLLDGDIVRQNLSSELGFSKEHRDLNILRIGFVASEITKNGGIALCAPIAPYNHVRKANREVIERFGGFILVHVSTPLDVCEKRDRKGLYAKARAGIIKEFTGISDPYEKPANAELTIDTTDIAPDEAANQIILYLETMGYISATRS